VGLLLSLLLLLFILTANWFLPGGSGTTIRHNTQNSTPRPYKSQHTKLNNKGHAVHNEYNAIQLKTITNTITATII
jgi:hypothetical protein